jgi:methylmalonyl-CoA mutase N-terminal domain/subunit
VCGGTQSLHTNALDEALGLPTEETARLALRTQQVIAHESGAADAADPLGGSWLIESWTDEIATRAREYIERLDGMGGALAGIERGFQQKEIADAAYRYQRAVESGEEVVVGVNRYRSENEMPQEVLAIDPDSEARQVERLRAYRERRDGERAEASLRALATAAGEDRNLMPPILDCVRADATLGEIADRLRSVYGEHLEGGLG